MYLPPNVTSLIQPMDQGVIECVKRFYRNRLLRALRIHNEEENVLNQVKKLTIKDCCYNLADAWELVSSTTLENAWNNLLKCREWCDDVEARHADVQKTLELIHRVPGFSTCTYEQVQSWIEKDKKECGWKLYDVNEILQR